MTTAAGASKLDTLFTGFRIASILDGTKIIFAANGREDQDNMEPTTGFFIKGFAGMNHKAAYERLQAFDCSCIFNENTLSSENEKSGAASTSGFCFGYMEIVRHCSKAIDYSIKSSTTCLPVKSFRRALESRNSRLFKWAMALEV